MPRELTGGDCSMDDNKKRRTLDSEDDVSVVSTDVDDTPVTSSVAGVPTINGIIQRDLFEITDGSYETPLRTYTNVMILWDMLPKYDVFGTSKRYHAELSPEDRVRVIPVKHRIHLDNLTHGQDEIYAELELEITPAFIRRKQVERDLVMLPNGKRKYTKRTITSDDGKAMFERVYVFPGAREDKVEEALKFLLAHGQGDFESEETWVRFSVRQLQKELGRTGITMSLDEIKEALQVLADSKCKIYGVDGQTGRRRSVVSSSFLPQLAMVDRDQYVQALKVGEETRCYAQFHMLVTQGIRNNQFRVTNYMQHQKLDNLLSRHIHRTLRIDFTYADYSESKPYPLYMKKTLMEYGRYTSRPDADAKVTRTALDELVKAEIVTGYDEEKIRNPKDRRMVTDRIYRLFPSNTFVNEMRNANSSRKRNEQMLNEIQNTRNLGDRVNALPKNEQMRVRLLTSFGVSTEKAMELASEYNEAHIKKAIARTRLKESKSPEGLNNPSGYLIKTLAQAKDPEPDVVKRSSSTPPTTSFSHDQDTQVNVQQLATLTPEHNRILLENWAQWSEGDRQTFNRHGLNSPHVREHLFGIKS